MAATSYTNATTYRRGDLELGYLRREYEAYLAREGEQGSNPEIELMAAYFDYHTTKLLNLYVLSGSHTLIELTVLLSQIVQLAFKIMVARGRDELKACAGIRAHGLLRHVALTDETGVRLELGNRGGSESGRSMVLGSSTSDEVARLVVHAEVNYQQLRSLRARPWMLRYIMNAFEDAVPLNLDFTVGFRVTPADRSFRLVPKSAATGQGDPAPLLGITTALG